MTGLVDQHGRPIASAFRGQRSAQLARSNEAGGRKGTFLKSWRPGLRSADADWLFDRNEVVARARDLSRNDPVGASAGARKINTAVGFSWRLSSRINARSLGVTPEQAREVRSQIEALFRPFAYGVSFQADAERKKTFGQLLRMGASHIVHDGEALGVIEYAADEPTQFKTRLRMVDPDRLSNPQGLPDTAYLRGGVERNKAMIPFQYWIREGHPNDLGATPNMIWNAWPRYSTPLGRPQVLHAFDELRAGQTRGVSRFVSAIKGFRALSKFTDATLEAATVNALWLGFVKSNAGPAAVSESFATDDLTSFAAEREDYYDKNPVELDGVSLPVLGLDDEVTLSTASKDVTSFDAFTRSILRLIAAALGITYEELSMDFSQTNYSSARAALAVAWNETLAFRGLIAAQIANPFYCAWLEEVFDLGLIDLPKGAPSFYDAMDAWCECIWIGPARGYIDPTKEIDAAAARIEAGVSTLEDENAEQGKDWEETIDQLGVEKDRLAAAGVTLGGPAMVNAALVARSPDHNAALDAPPPATK